jgi:hypothetical protein
MFKERCYLLFFIHKIFKTAHGMSLPSDSQHESVRGKTSFYVQRGCEYNLFVQLLIEAIPLPAVAEFFEKGVTIMGVTIMPLSNDV